MTTAFHPETDSRTDGMNASMKQYLRVFVNHRQDIWVQWLHLAEFAASTALLEMTQCTPFLAVQGTTPQMSFVEEPTNEQDH